VIDINSVVLIGRLAKDPELSFVPSSGLAVAKVNLAVDKDMSRDKKEEAKQQGKATADFIQVTIFGKQAENAANYLSKGSQCAVHGRINTGSYTTQTGEKRYTTDLIADRVEFIGQAKQQQNNNFDELPDIFEPADPNDVPF